jgi:hypothetical protein
MTGIVELGTTLAVTSNRCTQRFLQEPHGVTSKRTAFFKKTVGFNSITMRTLKLRQIIPISAEDEIGGEFFN